MAQRTDLEFPAGEPPLATSSGRESPSDSAGASNMQPDTSASELKTIQVLKEWPVVMSAVNKAGQYYDSLKNSYRIFNWSCTLAEKSVGALRERSSNVLRVFYPAVRIADLATSELAEQLQKKLPVVRQPPSQVSDAVKSGLNNLLAPLIQNIEFIVNKGKRRTRDGAKRVVQLYRKLLLSLDEYMERLEHQIKASKSKGTQAPQVQDPSSVREPRQPVARSLVKRAADAATNAGLFSVGASVCLLSKLPFIGRLLDQSPSSSPTSSKSTSPVRETGVRPSQLFSESTAPAGAAETVEPQLISLPIPESTTSGEAPAAK